MGTERRWSVEWGGSGQLTLQDRVADIVPRFGQNGKEEVTVLHLLTHTSGLPDMPTERLRAERPTYARMLADTGAPPNTSDGHIWVGKRSLGLIGGCEAHYMADLGLSGLYIAEDHGGMGMGH